jgi:hypothetical protein
MSAPATNESPRQRCRGLCVYLQCQYVDTVLRMFGPAFASGTSTKKLASVVGLGSLMNEGRSQTVGLRLLVHYGPLLHMGVS